MAVSTLIPVETAPGVDELWSMSTFFRADWSEPIKNTSSFETAVSYSRSVAEKRQGLRSRPVIATQVRFNGFTAADMLKLRAALLRAGQSKSLFPLYSDQTTITANLSAGVRAIPCDTTNRRLVAGSRVVIYNPTNELCPAQFHIGEVEAFPPGTINLTVGTALSFNVTAGAILIPLIESRPRLTAAGRQITDNKGFAQIEGVEVPGPTQLGTFCAPGTVPSELSSYLTYPILDLDPDFSNNIDFGVEQVGNFEDSGIGYGIEVFGSRPGSTLGYLVQSSTRAQAWKVIRAHHACCGRLFPLWVVGPESAYEPYDGFTSTTVLRIKAAGAELDWGYRPYICIVKTDGTKILRKINSVIRSTVSGTLVDALTLDAAVSPAPTLGQISRITVAYLSRFQSDALEEIWTTSEVMKSQLTFMELIEERAVTVSNLQEFVTSDPPIAAAPITCTMEPPNFEMTWYDDRTEPVPVFTQWTPEYPPNAQYLGFDTIPVCGPSISEGQTLHVVEPTGNNPYRWTKGSDNQDGGDHIWRCKVGVGRVAGGFDIPVDAVLDQIKVHVEVTGSTGTQDNPAVWDITLFCDTGTAQPPTYLTFRHLSNDNATSNSYIPKDFAGPADGGGLNNPGDTVVYETTFYKANAPGFWGTNPNRISNTFAWSKFTNDIVSERNGARFGIMALASYGIGAQSAQWIEFKAYIEITYILSGKPFTQRVGR